MTPRVLVSIVSYDSAAHLEPCFQSLRSQTYPDFTVSVWDNASSDGSLDIITAASDLVNDAHFASSNIGFSAAHNRIIASSRSDYILVLNPDVVLEATFLEALVVAMDQDELAGSATGKLWRAGASGPGETGEKILDSTGIYFTTEQRHLDRGSGQPDRGQYERREYVFGASGAAAFYRRAMLDRVKVSEEYFDESFFAYREDADLAWRAQWLGWSCLYVPEARAYHVRRVLPERRKALPAEINLHSFKNRFLLRVKNMDAGTYARFFIPITLRDLLAVGYVLLREQSSLGAFPLLLHALPRAWKVRRALQRHRKVSPREMRSWFARDPVTKPLSKA